MKIPFTKMHGAGNDYIYVNTLKYPVANPEALSIAWSRPHFGIGSDGLVLIGPSEKADFNMRIFNADGSEARMCGNASRCIGKYLYDYGLTQRTEITLETLSGIKTLHLHVAEGKVNTVTVDMEQPLLENKQQLATASGSMMDEEIKADGQTFKGTFVCMGNPHFVIFVPDVMKIPLTEIGPKLEHHPLFPERCNIEFAQIREDGSIRMRVWERGSGITLACGTGACATAVAASVTGRTGRSSDIEMDGGTLHIEWTADNRILMTGPATTVFDGEITI